MNKEKKLLFYKLYLSSINKNRMDFLMFYTHQFPSNLTSQYTFSSSPRIYTL